MVGTPLWRSQPLWLLSTIFLTYNTLYLVVVYFTSKGIHLIECRGIIEHICMLKLMIIDHLWKPWGGNIDTFLKQQFQCP